MIFIKGKPNSGKTTLAKMLCPNPLDRLSTDSLAIILALNKPNLALPVVNTDDEWLTLDQIRRRVNAFITSLEQSENSHLLFEEFLAILPHRPNLSVIEGYLLEKKYFFSKIKEKYTKHTTIEVINHKYYIKGKETSVGEILGLHIPII